jgi:phosphohistidine phosphatase
MTLVLVHHGDAVGPEVDPRRPLSDQGRRAVGHLAAEAARRGVKPVAVWHSGKLRARQTAEAYWRACNALATFTASRDLQPSDPIEPLVDRLKGESRDLLIAGHFPHLPRLLARLVGRSDTPSLDFPMNGIVVLETGDEGETWTERWRLGPDAAVL